MGASVPDVEIKLVAKPVCSDLHLPRYTKGEISLILTTKDATS